MRDMKQLMHMGVFARLGLVGVLFLGGCETMDGSRQVKDKPRERELIHRQLPEVEEQRSAEQLLVKARDWQRKAASVDGEWRDVGILIDQAEQAAAKGDYRAAMEKAEHARFQAEMGYRQMQAQEKVDNPAFLYF